MTELLPKKEEHLKVMIGVASFDGTLKPETQICIDMMVMYNLRRGILSPFKKRWGSILPNNRNSIIDDAIKAKVKYVLLIDGDMIFPEESMIKMLAKMKETGARVVSGLYHTKQGMHVPTMTNKTTESYWKPIFEWKKDEFIKADAVGFGLVLLDMTVFNEVSKPYFAMPPMQWIIAMEKLNKILFPKGNMSDADIVKSARLAYRDKVEGDPVLGEDYFFCEKLRQAGIDIFVDTSLKLGHIGTCSFGYDDFVITTGKGEIE